MYSAGVRYQNRVLKIKNKNSSSMDPRTAMKKVSSVKSNILFWWATLMPSDPFHHLSLAEVLK